MDKATNGNYSTVASGSDAELKAPVQTNTEKEDTTPDLGFATRENVDTSRLTALRQQIMTTDNKQSFKVEKTNTTNPIKTANTLNEKMSEAANNQDRLAIIKEFFEKSPMLKKALEKYVIGATDSLTILNALPTNARKYLAQKLTQKGLLKEEDIENADQTVLYRKQEIPKNTIVEKPGHNSKEVRKSPKTGDENRMDLWLVMLCVFGIAVVTEIVIYKRRNR